MSHQNSSSSGTSTVPTHSQSSSATVPLAETFTAQSLPPTHLEHRSNNGFNSILGHLAQWAVPLVSMILTGVIGYFSSLLQLKDEINDNRTKISVIQKEIEHVREDVKRMENDVSKIPAMNSDLAVMRTRLDISDGKRK